jgi:DNA-binding beta-propeller fold protein YncE
MPRGGEVYRNGLTCHLRGRTIPFFGERIAEMLSMLLAASTLALPGAQPPIFMDYLATEGEAVWVPGANTGKVFVLEAGRFRTVEGFPTAKGRNDRLLGPTSVGIGRGFAYIGNRGDSKICAVDARSLQKKGCVELPGMPDGTFFVAPAEEVWVTTPREKSIQILDVKDAAAPKLAGRIQLEGEPEGYAVDSVRGLVFTNLEDKDRTLAIDARSRKVLATFDPKCGSAGPRGLAVDAKRGLLLVACTDGVVALDEHDGARKGRLDTGAGVDNIDYLPGRKLIYAAAGRAERLTVAELGDDGSFKPVAQEKVGKGCRVVVATADGTAYVADGGNGQLWVVRRP